MKIKSGQYLENNWTMYISFNTGPEINRVFLSRLASYVKEQCNGKAVVDVGLRSMKAQQEAYERYKAGKGPLAALPGKSRHNYGLAADFNRIRTEGNIGIYPGTINADYNLWKQGKPETLNGYGLRHSVDGEIWHIEPIETKGVSVDDIAWFLDTDDLFNTSTGYPVLQLTEPYTIGTFVNLLQKKLGITADGIFGKDTDKAVKEYQSKNGLTTDGIVGTGTWSKLMPKPAEIPCKNCLALEKENALLVADFRELDHALRVAEDKLDNLSDKHKDEISRINTSHAQALTAITTQRDLAIKEKADALKQRDTLIKEKADLLEQLKQSQSKLSEITTAWRKFTSLL